MFCGRNLQHMALFGATMIGFCMVFQYTTLVVLTPGPVLGAPGQGLVPRRPGAPFWGPERGPEKCDFVRLGGFLRDTPREATGARSLTMAMTNPSPFAVSM